MANTPQAQRQHAAAAPATRPARTPVDRAKKFRELGEKRVTKALKALKHIGNLSAYDHSPEQVDQMFRILGKAMDDAAVRFTQKRKVSDVAFSFDK